MARALSATATKRRAFMMRLSRLPITAAIATGEAVGVLGIKDYRLQPTGLLRSLSAIRHG